MAEKRAAIGEHTKAPSVRASLVVRGFGDDPQVVTDALDRAPTRAGRVGDRLVGPSGQATSKTVRENFWSLHSRAEPRTALSQHINDILEQVGDARGAFARLPKGCTVTLLCTIIPEEDLPLLRVQASSLKLLGEIGADLEIDVISVDGPAVD